MIKSNWQQTNFKPILNHKTAMVVIDDRDLHALVCRMLRMSGLNGLPANSTSDAMEILEIINIGCLIMDCDSANSLELLLAVHRTNPDLPCLVITSDFSIIKFLENKRNKILLIKPFNASQFNDKVSQVLIKEL